MTEGGAGQALFSFVRHWSRRWDGTGDEEHAVRGRDVLAVEAVAALTHRGDPTVNSVAVELGVDQSNASRLIGHAADAGYLTLRRSDVDQRRRIVSITHSGRQLLMAAHAWQDKMYDVLTEGWTSEEHAAFARAIRRLVAKSPDLDPL